MGRALARKGPDLAVAAHKDRVKQIMRRQPGSCSVSREAAANRCGRGEASQPHQHLLAELARDLDSPGVAYREMPFMIRRRRTDDKRSAERVAGHRISRPSK